MRVLVTFENIQSGQPSSASTTFQPIVENRLRNAAVKIDNKTDYPVLVVRLSRTSNGALVTTNKLYAYCVTLQFFRAFVDYD